MINKILVAIDGSKSSLHASEYAIQLAIEIKVEIEIIYVIRHAIGIIDSRILPVDIEMKEQENAIAIIDKIKKEHPNIKINDFEPIGFPTQEINETIRKRGADLLVIGHHTNNFINQLIYGSVEDCLLKHLRIPMLVIPENYYGTKKS